MKKSSLQALTARVLGQHLEKTETTSNWHARPFRCSQVHYAVADAVTCLQLFLKFQELGVEAILPEPVPVQGDAASSSRGRGRGRGRGR